MTKTEKLNDLFARWNDGSFGVFIKDGIVCEERYENVLFLLKDVNNAKPDDINDMRIDVKQSTSGGKTWFDVALWSAALLDGKFFEEINHDIQHDQLKRVAIMNLKKEAGENRADSAEIRKCAGKDRNNILEEIKICLPRLVVACSRDVFYAFTRETLKLDKKYEYEKLTFTERMNGYGRYIDISGYIGASSPVYVVEYRHPCQCGRQGTREEHYKNMLVIREKFLVDSI